MRNPNAILSRRNHRALSAAFALLSAPAILAFTIALYSVPFSPHPAQCAIIALYCGLAALSAMGAAIVCAFLSA